MGAWKHADGLLREWVQGVLHDHGLDGVEVVDAVPVDQTMSGGLALALRDLVPAPSRRSDDPPGSLVGMRYVVTAWSGDAAGPSATALDALEVLYLACSRQPGLHVSLGAAEALPVNAPPSRPWFGVTMPVRSEIESRTSPIVTEHVITVMPPPHRRLEGRVWLEDRPFADAAISIDGATSSAHTDRHGWFSIDRPLVGDHHVITIEHGGRISHHHVDASASPIDLRLAALEEERHVTA